MIEPNLVLDGPGLAWIILYLTLLFVGISLVVGAAVALVMYFLLELPILKTFVIVAVITLLFLIPFAFVDRWATLNDTPPAAIVICAI